MQEQADKHNWEMREINEVHTKKSGSVLFLIQGRLSPQ